MINTNHFIIISYLSAVQYHPSEEARLLQDAEDLKRSNAEKAKLAKGRIYEDEDTGRLNSAISRGGEKHA